MLDNMLLGIQTAFSIHNLLYAFVGVFLGNVIGILPGIGALAAISMLLPVTYGLDHVGALVMLGGLYYGTTFGGATTSILLNLPGTASHAVVCLDGHPLAKKGRAGPAIFMTMFASFIGVCTGIVLMTFFSPLLVEFAFLFGPWEYFALMVLGLMAAAAIGSGSVVMSIASVVIGLILGTIGTDVNSGVDRFTFHIPELIEGLSLVALAMALFGVNDVLKNAGHLGQGIFVSGGKMDAQQVRPSREDLKRSQGPIVRGSLLGSAIGVLPGAGSAMASFMSYALEKKVSIGSKEFGKGAIEGVAGPEAANSSAAITAFIPTLVLGIPGSAVMALMLGAMMIHNINPGPQLLEQQPALFWGLLVSFWIGNFLLMLLNIPLIGMWVKLLSVPYRVIFPIVMFLIAIGVYSGNNNLFDVGVVVAFGVIGTLLALMKIEGAPLLLGFVLGPMIEENFRRAMLLARGDFWAFFTRPMSGSFMAVIIIMLLWVSYRRFARLKREAKAR